MYIHIHIYIRTYVYIYTYLYIYTVFWISVSSCFGYRGHTYIHIYT